MSAAADDSGYDAQQALEAGYLELARGDLEVSSDDAAPTLSQAGTLEGAPAQTLRDVARGDVLPPTDDRRRVVDTRASPFRAIAFLKMRYQDGFVGRGTAFFIGRRCLVTAAHNIHNPEHGAATGMEVVPAFDGRTAWFKVWRPVRMWIPPAYPGDPSPENDVGLLFLDQPVGDTVRMFGIAHFGNGFPPGFTARVCGYPTDRPIGQYMDGGSLSGATPTELNYLFDTAEGMSGSPVFFLHEGAWKAVGVHHLGDQSGNSARRFSPPLYNILAQASQS